MQKAHFTNQVQSLLFDWFRRGYPSGEICNLGAGPPSCLVLVHASTQGNNDCLFGNEQPKTSTSISIARVSYDSTISSQTLFFSLSKWAFDFNNPRDELYKQRGLNPQNQLTNISKPERHASLNPQFASGSLRVHTLLCPTDVRQQRVFPLSLLLLLPLLLPFHFCFHHPSVLSSHHQRSNIKAAIFFSFIGKLQIVSNCFNLMFMFIDIGIFILLP